MRKDITKKFLMSAKRYNSKMLSKSIVVFMSRERINIDVKQIRYDEIEFRNVFSTKPTNLNINNIFDFAGLKLKNIVEKKGKRIEFNMIYCKKGTFTMDSDVLKDKNSKKQVEIEKPFLLGETEVTQELYELVMGYNLSYFKGKKDSSQRPVEQVTWYDTIMFCNELSILMRKSPYYEIKDIEWDWDNKGKSIQKASVKINKGANGFRLPLSKEWEYAARAGTNNQWSGTSDKNKLGEYAWFFKNSNNETHPVATKKPNEWGFYDMSGNVFEWCSNKSSGGGSWFNEEPYLYSNTYDTSSRFNGVFSDMGFRVLIYPEFIEMLNLFLRNLRRELVKVEKNGKRVEFNMICCDGDKSHSEFLLGETEVTQELYELVMGYNPSWFKGKEDSSQRPVERVTWYDAIMFCNKLSILTNKRPYYKIWGIKYIDKTQIDIKEANVEINETANGFRLPLSEEWKYAAKAGTNNRWSGTNNENKLKEYAWFGEIYGSTHPVAMKKPNEWGFYDMSGNVFEWCSDKSIGGGSWAQKELCFLYSNTYDASSRFNGVFSDMGFRVAASL